MKRLLLVSTIAVKIAATEAAVARFGIWAAKSIGG